MPEKRLHLFIDGQCKLGTVYQPRERGRPKSTDAKRHHIDVRLTEDQLQSIEDAARKSGVSTTAWARDVLVNATIKTVEPTSDSTDVDAIVNQLNALTRQVAELTTAFNAWQMEETKKMVSAMVADQIAEMTPAKQKPSLLGRLGQRGGTPK